MYVHNSTKHVHCTYSLYMYMYMYIIHQYHNIHVYMCMINFLATFFALSFRSPSLPPSLPPSLTPSQHQGNFDECYQRLRSQTPQPLSPDMEQFYPDFSRTATLHTSRPTQYQLRPPQDHRAVRRHPTWDSGSQTLPLRSQRHATHDTRQLYGQGGVYMHSGVYDAAQGMGSTHSVQQPPQGWTTSFPREVPTNHSVQQPPQTWTTSFPREVPTNQGVIAGVLVMLWYTLIHVSATCIQCTD